MIGFGRIAAYCYALVLLLIGSTLAASALGTRLGLGAPGMIAAAGLLPALFAIAGTIVLERQLTGASLSHCVTTLGLGKPSRRQLVVTALCATPIVLAYCVVFPGFGTSPKTVSYLPWLIVKFILSQGIGEEIVFRGFAFRHLRTGRSFWRAAGLSALLFSSVHLAHLIKGVSPEILTNMTISILFSAFMGFSFACLYEYGGNSLWGCALLHVTIDSGNWFANAPDAGLNAPYLIMMLGLTASLVLVFPLVARDKALYE